MIRSIPPHGGSIRFRPAPRTYAPCGCIVRALSQTKSKSRKTPTRNASPLFLVSRYRLHPDDFDLLEIAIGAIAGQMTNIDATGAPGMLYNTFPHVQEHDP